MSTDPPIQPSAAPDAALERLITRRLRRIGAFPFRQRFHLRASERDQVARLGLPVVAEHAARFVAERLAPAYPARDGKQTPWGGHPVFCAQHATATCCRGCLERNHDIPRGRPLTSREQAYAVAVICQWIEQDLTTPPSPESSQGRATARSGRRSASAPTQPRLFG